MERSLSVYDTGQILGHSTYSSGARTNCIVFVANNAIHSSIELSVTASYALLNNAIRIFSKITYKSSQRKRISVMRLTFPYHYDKSINIVQYDAKWRCEIIEATEIRRLHDAIDHCLDDKARDLARVFDLVHANERLEKADADHDEQGEENETLFHHDLQHHQHGTEEAEGVEIQQQAQPEHRSAEGEEVVAQLVEARSLVVAGRIA